MQWLLSSQGHWHVDRVQDFDILGIWRRSQHTGDYNDRQQTEQRRRKLERPYHSTRPDPQLIGRQLAALKPISASQTDIGGRAYKEILRNPNAKLATGALIFGQLAMVAVMTVTPIHMHDHQHTLASISWVIMAHTMGMFGLSFVTGWLTDKLGRPKIILIGGRWSRIIKSTQIIAPPIVIDSRADAH